MIRPLMPKGVEHETPNSTLEMFMRVIRPLMPKGVEHLRLSEFKGADGKGDPSVDAERR